MGVNTKKTDFQGRPRRVCHLCSAHSVDDDRVFSRECVALAQAGYEVHLFAGGEEREPYRREGVTLHPLPPTKRRWQRFARRKHIARSAAKLAPDLFHVHEPELLGPTIAAARSRPVIWDVHESYLDVVMERYWIPRHLRRGVRLAWDWRERRLVRHCAAVIPVTEWVARRYCAMDCRVQIVANFPDLSVWEDLPALPRDGKTCVYTGVIGRARGLLEVVRAIGILKDRGLDVRLELAGPDANEHVSCLLNESARLGVESLVVYRGVLSRHDARMLAHAASIGILTYLPFGNNMAGWPTKMFQCMAHGIPMVYSDFPSYREVAESSGAGIAVDPTNPNNIADAIEQLVRNPNQAREMGEAGRRAVAERFNWEQEKAKLLMLYKEILGTSDISRQNGSDECVAGKLR